MVRVLALQRAQPEPGLPLVPVWARGRQPGPDSVPARQRVMQLVLASALPLQARRPIPRSRWVPERGSGPVPVPVPVQRLVLARPKPVRTDRSLLALPAPKRPWKAMLRRFANRWVPRSRRRQPGRCS
jgi:hypothetical protein